MTGSETIVIAMIWGLTAAGGFFGLRARRRRKAGREGKFGERRAGRPE